MRLAAGCRDTTSRHWTRCSPRCRRVETAFFTSVQAGGDSFSSVVTSIVKSYPFQHARGLKGETATLVSDASATLYHPVFVPPPPPPVDPNAPARGRGQGQGAARGQGAGRGR